MNNYPDGVTGEPQISGVTPPEQLADEVGGYIRAALGEVEEVEMLLDSQGALDPEIERVAEQAVERLEALRGLIDRHLIPEEPGL